MVAPPFAVLLVRAVLWAPLIICAAGFFGRGFLARVGRTGAFLAIGFLGSAFFESGFFATIFFAGFFFAGTFLAVAFLAVALLAIGFFAAGFFFNFATADESFFFNATTAKAKG